MDEKDMLTINVRDCIATYQMCADTYPMFEGKEEVILAFLSELTGLSEDALLEMVEDL